MSVWQQEKRKPLSTLSTISTFVDVCKMHLFSFMMKTMRSGKDEQDF